MAAIPTFVERRIRIESVDEKGRRNGQPSYEVTYVFDDEKAKFVRRDVHSLYKNPIFYDLSY